MRCLFCKNDSSESRSIEHVIPASLGNSTFTLPRGVVCDGCNNYFSRKVEQPVLNSGAIELLRFAQEIPSKKGRIPAMDGILDGTFPVRWFKHTGSKLAGLLDVPEEAIPHIVTRDHWQIIVPAEGRPPAPVMVSRFMAKMALEAMASRLVRYPDGLEYLVDEAQLAGPPAIPAKLS